MKYRLINVLGMMLVVVGENYITHRLDVGQSVEVSILAPQVKDLINRGFIRVLDIAEEQDKVSNIEQVKVSNIEQDKVSNIEQDKKISSEVQKESDVQVDKRQEVQSTDESSSLKKNENENLRNYKLNYKLKL